MNYLKIQSKGEIETEAFTLIGASSKRNDKTKIGYFGSGLKYSIASLIRNEIDFKIFKGENLVLFDKVEKNFRNDTYHAISVNGQETSLTTTMGGKDWDLPFAPIREIYSNAIDEDEYASLVKSNEVKGQKGMTTIFIEYNENVQHFFENFNYYFCNRNPNVLHTNSSATAYPKTPEGDLRLFRKGILCYHDEKTKALFSYNSENFEINESRVLSNTYSALTEVSNFWKKCTNEGLIKQLINGLENANSGYYEHGLSFGTWQSEFSTAWFEVFKNMKCIPIEMLMFCDDKDKEGRVVLPIKLLKPLFERFPDLDILGLSKNTKGVNYIVDKNPSRILTDKVVDAISKLTKTRYKSRLNNIDIEYVKFKDSHTLGLAHEGKIFLSTKLDVYSIDEISKIIIEENEHNITGFNDETREFQNHLFSLYFDELTNQKLERDKPITL